MTWFDEAKQIVLPRRRLIATLVGHFFHLRGWEFRRKIEKLTLGEKATTFLAVALVSTAVVWCAIEVNPLTAPINLAAAIRDAIAGSATFGAAGIIPMYLTVRVFGGQKAFWFIANLSAVGGLLIWATFVPSTFLAPQLAQDLQEIKTSGGQNTSYYKTSCLPIERKIILLSEEYERERMTGYNSLWRKLEDPSLPRNDSLDAFRSYKRRVASLREREKKRLQFLTSDIAQREAEVPNTEMSPQLLVRLAGGGALLLGDCVLLIFMLVAIWKGLVGLTGATKRTKIFAAIRVFLGMFIAFALGLALLLLKNQTWLVDYSDLGQRTASLSIEARSAELTCGHFDSRGLW